MSLEDGHMAGFANDAGAQIVSDLIEAIRSNRTYLSELDGAMGDGDHGINMSKGFTMCEEKLRQSPGNLSYSIGVLADTLLSEIGGSMGPLYGSLFAAMSTACAGVGCIDAALFGEMIEAGAGMVKEIGSARPRDKTMLDSLLPAAEAYRRCLDNGGSFVESLAAMKKAAAEGRDSTKNMVAMIGRARALGERTLGLTDPGAGSCCLILETMACSITELLKG